MSAVVTTHVVGEGDTAVTYDVHGDLADVTSERPALFLFGAPMDAGGFHQLAAQFPNRTVITYDPLGAGRNPAGTSDLSAAEHAEALHRVITALGVGAVDAFGSSGGAVCLLALLAAHPDDVRRAVVHEPPLAAGLADRDTVLAVIADMKDTYRREGDGAAMAKFIALVMTDGPLPADYLERPAPDPAMFGPPTEDDGSRTNPLFRNMPALIDYRLDVETLTARTDRIVVGVAAASRDELAARGARRVAAALDQPVVVFPSHHGGFTDQPGMPGEPEAFAARLRDVL